jgi:hypothetical protein
MAHAADPAGMLPGYQASVLQAELMSDCVATIVQKFGARRGSGGSTTGREEPVAISNNSRQTSNAGASGLERRPTGSAGRGGQGQQGAASTGTSGREKPALPELSDENCQAAYAEPLPTFREVPASEKQQLFVRKLHLCAFTFDFTDQGKAVREKEIKRQTLLELVDYVNTGSGKFTEAVAEDIVFMLSCNLFRALPPSKSHDQDNLDPDEEEPALEPAWPHLQVRARACTALWAAPCMRAGSMHPWAGRLAALAAPAALSCTAGSWHWSLASCSGPDKELGHAA